VIPVGNVDLSGKTATPIGVVFAVVKKPTLLHPNPTQKQADMVLAHKAKLLGADAVINVTYKRGIVYDSWAQIKAEGTAIRIEQAAPNEP